MSGVIFRENSGEMSHSQNNLNSLLEIIFLRLDYSKDKILKCFH